MAIKQIGSLQISSWLWNIEKMFGSNLVKGQWGLRWEIEGKERKILGKGSWLIGIETGKWLEKRSDLECGGVILNVEE